MEWNGTCLAITLQVLCNWQLNISTNLIFCSTIRQKVNVHSTPVEFTLQQSLNETVLVWNLHQNIVLMEQSTHILCFHFKLRLPEPPLEEAKQRSCDHTGVSVHQFVCRPCHFGRLYVRRPVLLRLKTQATKWWTAHSLQLAARLILPVNDVNRPLQQRGLETR